MAISYLLTMRECKLLALCCKLSRLPAWMEYVSLENQREIWNSLVEKGFVFLNGNQAAIDRTISFLFSQAAQADNIILTKEYGLLYETPKLCILLEQDEHGKQRCRLTPYRDLEAWRRSVAEKESEESEDDQ